MPVKIRGVAAPKQLPQGVVQAPASASGTPQFTVLVETASRVTGITP